MLISKTLIVLKKFQKNSKKPETGKLTTSWAQGFMSRHDKLLKTKRGYRMNHIRLKDLTTDNVQTMYDLTYEGFVRARVAVELPENEQYYVDKQGNKTSAENAVGRKVKYKITHPQWILHGDEVGTDTCQEDDGHIGVQVYLTANGKRTALKSSKASHRFTLICLTANTGEPVMYIIVFAANELDYIARFGYDFDADEPFDSSKSLEDQTGPGKVFPGAPWCEFRGKKIPAVVGMSEKGCITSAILVAALDKLDELGIYPRVSGGPIPFILLDAHDSRLQVTFLEKINSRIIDDDPAWVVQIGLPNGTSLWQVGDSSEQNGLYKISMTRAKDELVLTKQRLEMPIDFKRMDVMPLINKSTSQSFDIVVSNRKAIVDRGWAECDYRLLDHPDVQENAGAAKMPAASTSAPTATAAPAAVAPIPSAATTSTEGSTTRAKELDELNLNFTHGVAGTFTQDLLQHVIKKDALHKAYLKRKQEGTEAAQNLDEAVRLSKEKISGGTMFKCRHTACDDTLLRLRRDLEARKIAVSTAAVQRAVDLYNKRMSKYDALVVKGKAKYNATDLKVWCDVRRKKADKGLPSKAEDVKVYAEKLKDRDVLSLKEFLMDYGYAEELVDSVLEDPINSIVEAEDDEAMEDEDGTTGVAV